MIDHYLGGRVLLNIAVLGGGGRTNLNCSTVWFWFHFFFFIFCVFCLHWITCDGNGCPHHITLRRHINQTLIWKLHQATGLYMYVCVFVCVCIRICSTSSFLSVVLSCSLGKFSFLFFSVRFLVVKVKESPTSRHLPLWHWRPIGSSFSSVNPCVIFGFGNFCSNCLSLCGRTRTYVLCGM